jgi:hypothetical protein
MTNFQFDPDPKPDWLDRLIAAGIALFVVGGLAALILKCTGLV